eukprot:337722-Chlamydomonas_euryale.AAC.1
MLPHTNQARAEGVPCPRAAALGSSGIGGTALSPLPTARLGNTVAQQGNTQKPGSEHGRHGGLPRGSHAARRGGGRRSTGAGSRCGRATHDGGQGRCLAASLPRML